MGAILNTYFNMLLKSLGNTMLLTLLALDFCADYRPGFCSDECRQKPDIEFDRHDLY